MVIEMKSGFLNDLSNCPEDFQRKFRIAYQQLKVVERPLDIKGVTSVLGYYKMYKLHIDKSRIAMDWDEKRLLITCFLYNQFLRDNHPD